MSLPVLNGRYWMILSSISGGIADDSKLSFGRDEAFKAAMLIMSV